MNLIFLASEEFMLPCLNKKLFGIECPGCGIQRSVSLIFEGDLLGALKMYPAIYTLILMFMLIGLDILAKKKDFSKFIIPLAIINAIIIITNYILKFI
ncbi:DUF2752 domain-containing protein [Zhouia amylolytica]|uniref:DUF2752 domain-containing protein n=1 Tax=Zhouia amylolytica AD3 TaxID=1286632 RepID=W2UPK0_9FLAO|nr:DUF2752 domain-containing protein [Zhouia amylolytica]ETN96110.1 hypothetical protein P278_18320 [Zhouia amylolytica AD3]